jgi:hypothetical protein
VPPPHVICQRPHGVSPGDDNTVELPTRVKLLMLILTSGGPVDAENSGCACSLQYLQSEGREGVPRE